MRYKIKQIIYTDIDLSPDDLIGLAEAAQLLKVSLSRIRAMVDRNELTEVIDTEATNPNRDRRFLLRRDVENELFARRDTAA